MIYAFLFTGLLLLTLPAGFLTGRRHQRATLVEIADRERLRMGWVNWLNLLDLSRAWAGLFLIREAFLLIHPAAAGHKLVLLVLTAAALAGLILQQVFHHDADRDELVAPAAYAIGLTLAFLPPQVALLALPLGLASALALRSVGSGFLLSAAAVGAVGILFHQSMIKMAAASCLLLFTPLLAALLQRRLVLIVRGRSHARPAALRHIPVVAAR